MFTEKAVSEHGYGLFFSKSAVQEAEIQELAQFPIRNEAIPFDIIAGSTTLFKE